MISAIFVDRPRLAFVISIVLQLIFLASFLPAVLANGSTAGIMSAFFSSSIAGIAGSGPSRKV